MQRRVAFLLFSAGWGANHFSTLLVVYRSTLGLSASALGLLFGGYALGLVPGLILAGRASDELGRRALVLPASALCVAASALLSFGGHGFGVLFGGRLLYGLAMGCVMSPGSVWIQELSSAEAGPRLATLALSAGFGVGPVVSGIVAQFAPAPMILPYVVHGSVMVLALLGARAVSETAPLDTPSVAAASATPEPRVVGRAALALLGSLLPVAPWAFGLASVTLAILPGLMRPHVPRPVLYSAFVVVTTLFAGVAVQPLTSRLGRRGDLLGLGIGALGILLAAHAVALGSPDLVFGVAVLIGIGYGLVMTTGLREVSIRVPKRARGTVVGVYYVLTYVGFALPFLHARAAQHVGDVRALQATAAIALGCLVLRALMLRRGDFPRPSLRNPRPSV